MKKLLFAIAILWATTSTALAQTNWQGGSGDMPAGAWDNAANWSGAAPSVGLGAAFVGGSGAPVFYEVAPIASNDFYVQSGATPTIAGGTALTLSDHFYIGRNGVGTDVNVFTQKENASLAMPNDKNIWIGNGTGASNTYNLEGGSIVSMNAIVVGAGSSGEFNVSQNNPLYPTSINANQLIVGYVSTGVSIISDATINLAEFFYVGHNNGGAGTATVNSTTINTDRFIVGNANGSTGTLVVNSSTINISDASTESVCVGNAGNGTITQTGGSINLNRPGLNTQDNFFITNNTSSTGTYNLQGGTLYVQAASVIIGYKGLGVFNQSGGEMISPNGLQMANGDGTANGTYNLDGGILRSGSGISGGSGTEQIFLSGGTIVGTSTWATTLDATLDGDGMGNDVTFEFDDTTKVEWNGNLSGTGGLRIKNLGATPWVVPGANYLYTGATTAAAGTIDMTDTTNGTLASTRLIAGNDTDPVTSNPTYGTLLATDNTFAAAPGTTHITFDGGILQMQNAATGGPFDKTVTVRAAGGTLESIGAGSDNWIIAGTTTFDATSPNGTLNLTGTTTGNEITGQITGDGNLTKSGTGDWTLSGTNAYTGTTTVSAGTLAVTGTLYNGLTAGTLAVQDGATLSFTGAGTLGLQDGSTLTLDLHQNATFTPQAGGFGLTNLNLVLQGNRTNYDKAFIESITASQLNSLVVAQGLPFALTMDRTGGTIAGGLTVTAGVNLNPMDLSITLTGDYSDVAAASVIDVIVTGTGISSGAQGWENLTTSDGKISVGNIDTSAVTFPANFILDFYYGSNKLYGEFTDTTPPPPPPSGGTNSDASLAILYTDNPTGDTAIAQNLLNAASTNEEKDKITQQFTPSMAMAQAAQAVQTSSQLLQTVGQQVVVPWDSAYTSGANILRANNGYDSLTGGTNTWLQSFGYAGEQAVKDNFAGYNNSGYGLAVGTDRVLGAGVVGGLAYGYSQTSLDSQPFISGSETPSSVNTKAHSILGYTLFRTSRSTFLSLKAGNTWYDVDGVRRPFASDPSKIYTYKTKARTWYLQATLAWQWMQRPAFSLTPKAKLAYFDYSQDAYEEVRPGLTPSSVAAYSNGYTQTDLLLDLQVFLSKRLTLNASFGYRGLVGAEGAVMGYNADGLSYNVNGVSAAQNQFVLDTGTVYEISRSLTLITEYNYRVGEGSYLHGGTGSLVLTF